MYHSDSEIPSPQNAEHGIAALTYRHIDSVQAKVPRLVLKFERLTMQDAELKEGEVVEFANFCREMPELWEGLLGKSLLHDDFGRGVVIAIRPREGAVPLIDVGFEGVGVKSFNEVAFLQGRFTTLCVSSIDIQKWDQWRRFVQNVKLLREARDALLKRAAENSRVPPFLTDQDFLLCLCWANHSVSEDFIPEGVALRNYVKRALGNFEASRLISARRAEMMVCDYYRDLGLSVEDVSIKQLSSRRFGPWVDFDVDVGYPVDVKNARASVNGREHFAEHAVARFKLDRVSKEGVRVVGVRSPYFPSPEAANRADDKAVATVLGEVTLKDIDGIKRWLLRRFGGVLQLDDFWQYKRLPGWFFEYPDSYYSGRAEVVKKLKEVLSQLDHQKCSPALLLVARAYRLDVEASCDVLLGDIGDLLSECGLAKRCIIFYAMCAVLEAVLKGESGALVAQKIKALITVKFGRKIVPLGLEDPLGYVDRFLEAFVKLGGGISPIASEIRMFRLKSPDILEAVMFDGRRQTVLAYCGGWIEGMGRCGAAPLVIGQDEICEACHRLVCVECGFCSERCSAGIARVSLCSVNRGRCRWRAYHDGPDDLDDEEYWSDPEDWGDVSGEAPSEAVAEEERRAAPTHQIIDDDGYWSAVIDEIDKGSPVRKENDLESDFDIPF